MDLAVYTRLAEGVDDRRDEKRSGITRDCDSNVNHAPDEEPSNPAGSVARRRGRAYVHLSSIAATRVDWKCGS